MKEGHPVTLLFLAFIIIVYIGGYIWDIQTQNNQIYKVMISQEDIIQELKEENKDLHTLTETLFQYIYTLEGKNSSSSPPWTGKDSPIHNKPI
tara:strand:- start:374 stop:652 length:279 start_codon:yes stop_codon:yes gene_type:complete